jgi:hypothetical protein
MSVRDFYLFFVAVLAVWRVTHLLTVEDGPFRLMARLRRAADGSFFGYLLNCFNLLSFWVAALFAAWIAGSGPYWGIVWLALAAGACILERLTVLRTNSVQRTYFEPKQLIETELLHR